MKMQSSILESPEVTQAFQAVTSALSNRYLVVIAGLCTVEYTGRATSKLSLGERLLIVKGDSSLLLHRPRGVEPVNWQPPGCRIRPSLTPRGTLRIEAIRLNPQESVIIEFKTIPLLSALGLEDRGSFSLYASEEDMKEAI